MNMWLNNSKFCEIHIMQLTKCVGRYIYTELKTEKPCWLPDYKTNLECSIRDIYHKI